MAKVSHHEPERTGIGPVGRARAWEGPQIRFALSRGFVIGGWYFLAANPGQRSQTRLPWATIGHPSGVLIQRLRRMVSNQVHGPNGLS